MVLITLGSRSNKTDLTEGIMAFKAAKTLRPWDIVFVVCLIEEHILPVDPLSCMLLDVEEVNICLFATAL